VAKWARCRVTISKLWAHVESVLLRRLILSYVNKNINTGISLGDPSTKRLKISGQVALRHLECGFLVFSQNLYLHGPCKAVKSYRCFCCFSDVPCRFVENDKKAPARIGPSGTSPARPRIGPSRNMPHMAPSSPQRLGMNPISLDSPRCVDMAPMLRQKSGAFGC